MRRVVAVLVAVLVGGCGASASAVPSAAPSAAIAVQQAATIAPAADWTLMPTNTPTPTPEATAEPTAEIILPTSYANLTSRNWAKVVKAPDTYIGKGYVVWACITQFDAATGTDTFRGDASYRNEKSAWYNGSNAFFTGTDAQLADFVQDDIVTMNVVGLGSYSYDTQMGGNTTVPLFLVLKITRKGSCA